MKIEDIIQGGKPRRKTRGMRQNRVNGASLSPVELRDNESDCPAEEDKESTL